MSKEQIETYGLFKFKKSLMTPHLLSLGQLEHYPGLYSEGYCWLKIPCDKNGYPRWSTKVLSYADESYLMPDNRCIKHRGYGTNTQKLPMPIYFCERDMPLLEYRDLIGSPMYWEMENG